ncbi:hypothetical protein L1987_24860 [Smallanthus sonchifolius]|uniref:Uncharacterized protein n=1 Tax=Smallanthus sonchifolius TaxID=185202 RepID=A0ACB9ILE5_9ASTR|nr:hypothetical protein L1987_24860 [Smallanthus sonchifolius]
MHFAAFSTLTYAMAAQNSTTGDRLALLAIKSKIKDDPKDIMNSWNHSSTNFCHWQGVTCGARHQRVTHLDLSSGGLVGKLSPSIGNLSFLRSIRLSNNSFYGEIPPQIGRLFRLQELRLYINSFTGNIPAAIMNCSNLQFLQLGHNKLVGKIPEGIGSLSVLNTLTVYGNILEGGIPVFIANLTLLETLSLNDCQLGGSLPDVFQRLTNLRIFAAPGNNLIGTIPPSLYNCSSLELVSLGNNQLTSSLNHIQGNFLAIRAATLCLLDLSIWFMMICISIVVISFLSDDEKDDVSCNRSSSPLSPCHCHPQAHELRLRSNTSQDLNPKPR